MKHALHSAVIMALALATTGYCPIAAQPAGAPPGRSAGPDPADSRQSLEDAALARRIEEYSDTTKGEQRAAADHQARATAQRFVAALVANERRAMLTEAAFPWLDRAELIRDEATGKQRIAEYRLPGVFATGAQQITLLASLEELERVRGKRVPEAARKTWVDHLKNGARIAVVQGGPVMLGLSVRRVKSEYRVTGLLFDYFPRPDDPLLRAVRHHVPALLMDRP